MEKSEFLKVQLKGQEEAAKAHWKLSQLTKAINNFEGTQLELENLLEQQIEALEKLIDLYSDRIGLILKFIPE